LFCSNVPFPVIDRGNRSQGDCPLPHLDNRLAVITELHTAINKRFKEAGIEIAFPQRDLHLRRGWEMLRGDRQRGTDEA